MVNVTFVCDPPCSLLVVLLARTALSLPWVGDKVALLESDRPAGVSIYSGYKTEVRALLFALFFCACVAGCFSTDHSSSSYSYFAAPTDKSEGTNFCANRKQLLAGTHTFHSKKNCGRGEPHVCSVGWLDSTHSCSEQPSNIRTAVLEFFCGNVRRSSLLVCAWYHLRLRSEDCCCRLYIDCCDGVGGMSSVTAPDWFVGSCLRRHS